MELISIYNIKIKRNFNFPPQQLIVMNRKTNNESLSFRSPKNNMLQQEKNAELQVLRKLCHEKRKLFLKHSSYLKK